MKTSQARFKKRAFAGALVALICLVAVCAASARLRVCASLVPVPHPSSLKARRALVISIDGLDVRYLLKRDEYGLKIPTLRRLMAEGATAQGVVSVYPSLTYPAHTTIVTGVRPRRHGIYSNSVFDPPPAPPLSRWHWFARDIQTETLWTAAAREGLKSGMISWPVAAGAGDWNVPEIWKAGTSPGDSLTQTLGEMSANALPHGLVEEIAKRDPQVYARVTKDESDDMRTRQAEYVISEKRPELMFAHLFDLDHFEHWKGPFTPEAFAMLEKSDAYVARLLAAAERAGTLKETAVFIVSDHGFKPISKQIQPGVILARAGLLTVGEARDAQGRTRSVVTDWRVLPDASAGSCAVILRDPKDEEGLRRARAAFRDFAGRERGAKGEPALRLIDAGQVAKLGANPLAAFMLEGAEGYAFGDNYTGEPVVASQDRGQHGYLPNAPDYRTSFIASGAGVTRRGSLGTIQLVDIAPTIARLLGFTLSEQDGSAIKLED